MNGLADKMTREMTFKKSLLIPLLTFLLLVVALGLGFGLKDPHLLPSALIDKEFPAFELPDLHDADLLRSRQDLLDGDVSLVNVWATWCANCLVEHPELMRIAAEEGLPIYGVNYNDDATAARAWLQRHGNPFAFSVEDKKGSLVIDLGVYGAPETFVVDAAGIIRLRHVGPVTREVWQQQLAPVVAHLVGEAGDDD
ncbi:MAG: DsbE family thiol:disulfide interchange protein [Pseudomonadales bacterium]